MEGLARFLRERADGDLLPWRVQADAAVRFGLSPAVVELAALEKSLLPARYQRNRQMITAAEQLRLFRSRVAVLGCGGLGGYLLEELARLGIGQIIAVDPDVFEEHNLNRQLFSSPDALGEAKVQRAADRIAAVNPAVTVTAVQKAFSAENGPRLLTGCHAAVDGLDSIPARQALASVCSAEGVPLVHGAIAGWYGQVATQLPGDTSLQRLFAQQAARGVEQRLGNPSFTPAVVASLEAAEVCKLLLGRGTLLRDRALIVDLLDMEFTEIPL